VTRRVLQLACVFLLIFSQQAALTHVVWHTGNDAGGGVILGQSAHAHDGHHHDAPINASCAFDLVFCNVLGGHGVVGMSVPALAPELAFFNRVSSPRLASEAIPAVSRGPPVSL